MTLFPNKITDFDKQIAVVLAQLAHFVHPRYSRRES